MRLRHIRGAEEAIETSPFVVQEPKEHRGHFCELFGNTNPIQIEVGMGKGKFIMELAQKHPETNFIGIERYSSVLLRALQKREELEISNIYFMCVDAKELGEIFDRQAEADALVAEFTDFYEEYSQKNAGKEHPKVLILMGLPGSYIIATENSYVGSLVAMAGGENVYAGTDQEFLTVNTEDMKTKEPDIILRTAHALPDQVVEMFKKDFATNDIWKHFQAVQEGRVYDLTYELFGMSATFRYPEALEELQPILYPESDEDLQKAQENSEQAAEAAEDSGASERYEEIQKGE